MKNKTRNSSFKLSLIAAAVATALSPAAQATDYNWTTGSFVAGVTAPDPLLSPDTLTISPGGTKIFNVDFSNQSSVTMTDNLYFQYGHTVTNSGTWDIQADVGLYNSYAGGNFVNSGIFRKSAGTGTTLIGSGVGFTNNGGTINAQTGTINFNSGAAAFNSGTQFTGAGHVTISSNASFAGIINSQNLQLTGGTFTGTGAQINGTVNWTGGTVAGTWTVASGQALNVQANTYKDLYGGSSNLTNQGTINATGNLYFQYGATLTNNGLYDAQADVGLVNTYAGGNFVNNGTFRKSGGTGTTNIGNSIGFTNNGTIEAKTGTINFSGGSVAFNAGTQFTGAGQVVVSNNASFNGAFNSQNLHLTGGTFAGFGAKLNGTVNWTAGVMQGDWTVASGQTLNVQNGGTKSLYGGSSSLTNNGTINATDNLYFHYGATLTNNGLYNLQSDMGLVNSYAGGNFVNNGTFQKSGGTGTSYIGSGIGFTNNGGIIDAQTGTINFNSGAAAFNNGTQFTGAGQVVVTNNARFNGAFNSQNLYLTSGTFTGGDGTPGSKGQANGVTNWAGGSMAGTWEVASGQVLNVQAGTYKYLYGGSSSLTNQGTINATDDLYFQYGANLTNNGLYDAQADVGLYNSYAGGYFINNGTFRKSASTGTTTIGSGIGFINSGTIKAQTGTINFSGGSVAFNAGTQFTGAGQVVVSNNASFNGAFNSQNLYLTGGTFTGSGAKLNGTVNWTGGSMAGTWEVASGQTLNVQSSGTKILYGGSSSLTNQGTINATDNLHFQYGATLINNGLYNLQSDVGLVNSYAGGNFINNGTLLKSGGTGTTSLAGIGFSNTATGKVVVDTGTVYLGQAFANQGTLDFGISGLGNNGVLAVGNTATLGGLVQAHLMGGFKPVVGDSFTVMTYTSETGAFANSNWTFGGVTYAPVYTNTSFSLDVTNVVAVPEPGEWALMLGGLGLMGFIINRRYKKMQS